MTDAAAQPACVREGAHLVLYDGVCGLCSRLLQFLLAHDRHAVFAFAPLQGPAARAVLARADGDPAELTSFYVVANHRTARRRILARSEAALFVASQLGWPWKAAVVARILPRGILDRVYDVVARNRYRVFGRLEQCLPPLPEFRRRLVE